MTSALSMRRAAMRQHCGMLFGLCRNSGQHGACFTSPSRRRFLSSLPLVEEASDDAWKEEVEIERKRQMKHHTPANSTEVTERVGPEDFSKNFSKNDEFPHISPSSLMYAGGSVVPVTSNLKIVTPGEDAPAGIWPVFRLMDENGQFRDPAVDRVGGPSPSLPPAPSSPDSLEGLKSFLSDVYPFHAKEFEESGLLRDSPHPYADTASTNTLIRAHRQMIRLRQMDDILLSAQRQGRISFYMTCTGEEAIQMGVGSALDLHDPIFAQYREQGLLMWRGFTLEQFTNQCFSNDADLGKGRQMPVHYGSRALNYHTVSSPLGTQIPQAAGAAYRLKVSGQKNVAVCFFGDGCASTTDFHSGLNFAATLGTPVLFVCRNNGYAISTPVQDQYAGDGIVSRAPGYGMAAIRVDGNDIFAVHAAVRHARRYALEAQAPVLLECMTYRQGHHSTSDDSSRYRSAEEIQDFVDRLDPVTRIENFFQRHTTNWLTEDETATVRDEEKIAVLRAMEMAEKRARPGLEDLFTDVYSELPPSLREQRGHLQQHLKKYPNEY